MSHVLGLWIRSRHFTCADRQRLFEGGGGGDKQWFGFCFGWPHDVHFGAVFIFGILDWTTWNWVEYCWFNERRLQKDAWSEGELLCWQQRHLDGMGLFLSCWFMRGPVRFFSSIFLSGSRCFMLHVSNEFIYFFNDRQMGYWNCCKIEFDTN